MHPHDRVGVRLARASRRRSAGPGRSRTPAARRRVPAPASTPSPAPARSPMPARDDPVRISCSEPGSQSSSSRGRSGLPSARLAIAGARQLGEVDAHGRLPGRAPRCGRRTRTSSRSPSGAAAVARSASGSRARRARSRGRGPRRAPRSRASAGRPCRAGRARSRSPRPRRRRRAGGRSPTWSSETGASARSSPSAALDRVGLGAVVERGRGAVGVDVVDVARPRPGVRERQLDRARRRRGPSGSGAVRWWASEVAP